MFDTRTRVPPEAGNAAHTATPTEATAANADTTVATQAEVSHRNTANTPHNPATSRQVTTNTTRRALTQQSSPPRGTGTWQNRKPGRVKMMAHLLRRS